jgi:NADH:ubiquinone oxidoreductase subunit 6 (subunit J)
MPPVFTRHIVFEHNIVDEVLELSFENVMFLNAQFIESLKVLDFVLAIKGKGSRLPLKYGRITDKYQSHIEAIGYGTKDIIVVHFQPFIVPFDMSQAILVLVRLCCIILATAVRSCCSG